MNVLEGFLKSKTIWFNVLSLAAAIFMSDEIKAYVDPMTLIKIQTVINIVLRLVTTQSVAEKGNA